MLYPESKNAKLNDALFRDPTPEYRGAPFWAWNCKLDRGQLLRQLDVLKEMGFGGAHIHSRTGLDTPYLGDEFMANVRACVDKCEQEGQKIYLYDEDRWPSGTAGGKVTAFKPFRRKRLEWYPDDQGWNEPKETALENGVPYLLACYDVRIGQDGYLADYQRIARSETASGSKWFVYVVNEKESTWFNGSTYLDAMDRDAVAAFLKNTHEVYFSTVGERFGSVIPSIFTDEPNVDHEPTVAIPTPEYSGRIKRGWSRFFEEAYEKRYGEDLLDRLPELVWNRKDGSDSVIKYRCFDLMAELFSKHFCGQIGEWCRDHRIAFTGHLLDEPRLQSQAITCGETMRSYPHFDIPGIDMLCDFREWTTAKQVSSVVHQYGKEGAMSELYGVTNYDFDFRGHKFQGDWQAALGITLRVPHLSWVSMKGEAKRDYPASIHYQSPWYKEYPLIEDHFARLNTVLTRGKAIVRIGVIHPAESAWLFMGPASQDSTGMQAMENRFSAVTRWLLENHLDFDYICESLISSLSKDDPRALGDMRYDAIVVPGCISLRSSTIAFLSSFRKNGGKVVFMGSCPVYTDGTKSDACRLLYEESVRISEDPGMLTRSLEEEREISVRDRNGLEDAHFLYAYREDGPYRWLFIARGKQPGDTARAYGETQCDVIESNPVTVRIRGLFRLTKYDTLTGRIAPAAARQENGSTLITADLSGYDSLLFRLEPGAVSEETLIASEKEAAVRTKTVRGTVHFERSEPNVLLLDQSEWSLDDGPWEETEEALRIDNIIRKRLQYPPQVGSVAQPYCRENSRPAHRLTRRFTIRSQESLNDMLLAAEDAEISDIRLNGKPVPAVVKGYFTDEAIGTIALPGLQKGDNLLEITIPYGPRTFVEWCYLLGSFGVTVRGTETELTKEPESVGFGDLTGQGFPFYGANMTYQIPVRTETEGKLMIRASCYRGALIGVSIDGTRAGSIVFPPYEMETAALPAGDHTVSLTLFGNRHNSFGPLHMVNTKTKWIGPNVYRTEGDDWCFEYRTKPFGILKAPEIGFIPTKGETES